MIVVAIEVGLIFGAENGLEGREFRHLFRLEVFRFVQDKTIAVAQDVGGEPTVESQTARAEDGGEATLHEGLSSLEILTCDGHALLFCQLPHGWDVHGGVGRTHDERRAFHEGSIGIAHGGSHMFAVIGTHGSFE